MLANNLNTRDSGAIHQRQQATAFDGILEHSRDLICERLNDAIVAMLDKSEEALSGLMNETQDRDVRRLYEEARGIAVAQRQTMEQEFQSGYLGGFRRRSDRARRTGENFGEIENSPGVLELVSDDDLEETLKFNDMATRLRTYCDEELVALDQRVGVLLGDANLQAGDNPFSPQVICDAYKHACRQLDANVNVRRVLLKLFDDHVLDDIRSVYKAVNALLVRNSILPRIRYSVSRKPDRVAPAQGGPADAETRFAAPGTDNTAVPAQDLFSVLQNLFASNVRAIGQRGVGGGTGAAAVQAGAGDAAAALQGAELLGSLTRIQLGDLSAVAGGSLAASAGVPGTNNVLHELKSTSVGAGMGQLDLMTLDIMAMLFDQLFEDPKVPNGVKGLIGRIQIPMLKVAIADKSFFSTKTHPARLLLDTLGEVVLRLPADFSTSSPLFSRLQEILQKLIDEFKDELSIFATVREQLQSLVAEEDQRIEQETQTAAKSVEEMEDLALAKSVAQDEVRARVTGRTLPGPVLEFLIQQWLKVLLLLHVKEGKESRAWTDAVESMDQLVWSIEPKNTLEERRKLAALVPGLIKQLSAGLKAAGIADDVRGQFFADLMQYHTQAISASGQGNSDPASAAHAVRNQADRATAARQRAVSPKGVKAEASRSPDFSGPVIVKNPFGDGDVHVENLDLDLTVHEAGQARAKRDASIGNLLDRIAIGTWVELCETGDQSARRPVRLIFVSPRKTRYLFAVDRAGKEIIQCTRAEISRRFRVGEATVMDKPPDESLFDRIMSGLVGKLHASGTRH